MYVYNALGQLQSRAVGAASGWACFEQPALTTNGRIMQPRSTALYLCDATIYKARQKAISYRLTPRRHHLPASIYTSLLHAATY